MQQSNTASSVVDANKSQPPPLTTTSSSNKASTNNTTSKFKKNSFGIPQLPLGIQYKEVIIFTCWLAAVGFTIWFIVNVTQHYQHAQHNPITSLSLVEHIPLDYPAITICNYNAYENCGSECGLELIQTSRVLENGSVIEFEHDHEYKIIDSFHCVVINNETHSNFPQAFMTGYGAAISLYFKLPNSTMNIVSRSGLQVSFHEKETCPNLNAETNFAVSGMDNFFILTKIETKRLITSHESTSSSSSESSTTTPTHRRRKRSIKSGNTEGGGSSSTSESDGYQLSVRWETILSNIGLGIPEDDLVVVSFSYSTLNLYELEEQVTISIESILGEIGAIIGVLAGVDVVKILRGFAEIPFAVYVKSFRPIWEIFN